jgi:type II secretory pathway component PulC
LFADITLRGIIYSPDARRSVALVQVGSKRTFRLRSGDVIGNARVLEIQPQRVRFAVENFGTIRTEVLDLRGTTRVQTEPIREISADSSAPRTTPLVPDRNERDMISAPPKPNPVVKQNNDGRPTEQPEAAR